MAQQTPSVDEIKRSEHTGLLFPSGRIWKKLNTRTISNDAGNTLQNINPESAVYLSAVLESMTSQILQLAGHTAQQCNKTHIKAQHSESAFRAKQSQSRQAVPASPLCNENPSRAPRSRSDLTFFAEMEADTQGADIPGLHYVDGFISEREHADIVRFVNRNEWQKRGRCLVQHYAHSLHGDALHRETQRPFDALPRCVEALLERVVREEGLGVAKDMCFDQLTVDNYPSCGGLASHVESARCFGECVCVVSLLHEAVVCFERVGGGDKKQVLLRPRSLMVLSGEARYGWRHGIAEEEVHDICRKVR